MKRQSSKAHLLADDTAALGHSLNKKKEECLSPAPKRQASSANSDSNLATDPYHGENSDDAKVKVMRPLLNHSSLRRPEQQFEKQGEKVFNAGYTEAKSRCDNGQGNWTSALQGAETDLRPKGGSSAHRTGLVFARSPKHFDPSNSRHKEREVRITCVQKALDEAGLLRKCRVIVANDHATEVESMSAPAMALHSGPRLSEEDYERVHRPAYLRRLERLSTLTSDGDVEQESGQYQSVYLTPHSFAETKVATNGLCELVRLVLSGTIRNGFAVIRPPGHHAEAGLAGGYCLLNHVAIAARYAQAWSSRIGFGDDTSSDGTTSHVPSLVRVQRVLIVDWDVHMGNGTQQILENDPSVLYFSVHRWHLGRYYPYHSKGGPANVGRCLCPSSGTAVARNVNVGWTDDGMGDDEYRAVWQMLLLPMAREFQPDLVLVSAGFDAAAGDVGDCNVTPECFAFLTTQLRRLAGGRVVCSLEGGYVPSVLSACVTRVVEALVSELDGADNYDIVEQTISAREDVLKSIDPTAAQNIRSTIEAHRPYWRCLSR